MSKYIEHAITKPDSGNVIRMQLSSNRGKLLVNQDEIEILQRESKVWQNKVNELGYLIKIVTILLENNIRTARQIDHIESERNKKLLLDTDIVQYIPDNGDDIDDLSLKNHYLKILASFEANMEYSEKTATTLKNVISRVANGNSHVLVPAHTYHTTRAKQKGQLGELNRNDETARALLKQKVNENKELTVEEREEALKRISNPSNNATFELDYYLGKAFKEKENLVLRALRQIIDDLVLSQEIESYHFPIKIELSKIYELCGLTKGAKGKGYQLKETQEVIKILIESALTEQILVKDEFNNCIKATAFILEREFSFREVVITKNNRGQDLEQPVLQKQYTHVTIKISDFLFANSIKKQKQRKYWLQETQGFINFRKINKTKIGSDLFLWFEVYLSSVDAKKELNLETIINTLELAKSYKKNTKRVVGEIERAFEDMVTVAELISKWEKGTGSRGQVKYLFTNGRYKSYTKIIDVTINGSAGFFMSDPACT